MKSDRAFKSRQTDHSLEDFQLFLIQLLSDHSRGLHLPSASIVLLAPDSHSPDSVQDRGFLFASIIHNPQPRGGCPKNGSEYEASLWRERLYTASAMFVPVWVWNTSALLLQLARPSATYFPSHVYLPTYGSLQWWNEDLFQTNLLFCEVQIIHPCTFTFITTTDRENILLQQGQEPHNVQWLVLLCRASGTYQCVGWVRIWDFCSLSVCKFLSVGRSFLEWNMPSREIINRKI